VALVGADEPRAIALRAWGAQQVRTTCSATSWHADADRE
jgi:hypothetical protein